MSVCNIFLVIGAVLNIQLYIQDFIMCEPLKRIPHRFITKVVKHTYVLIVVSKKGFKNSKITHTRDIFVQNCHTWCEEFVRIYHISEIFVCVKIPVQQSLLHTHNLYVFRPNATGICFCGVLDQDNHWK